MPDHLGDDMRKVRLPEEKEEEIRCKSLLLYCCLGFVVLGKLLTNPFSWTIPL